MTEIQMFDDPKNKKPDPENDLPAAEQPEDLSTEDENDDSEE